MNAVEDIHLLPSEYRMNETGFDKTASCHAVHTGTHLITKVRKRWARLVLVWVTDQMTSMPGAVGRSTLILWPGKASEKIQRRVIPPVCVKCRRTSQEKIKKKRVFSVSYQPINPLGTPANRRGHGCSMQLASFLLFFPCKLNLCLFLMLLLLLQPRSIAFFCWRFKQDP
jgi:hypothetical protein